MSQKPFVAMVLKKRANGETLAAIGDSIQQTRESIRQKESKAKSIFIFFQSPVLQRVALIRQMNSEMSA